MQPNPSRAFTLLELLSVIAIIGVLAGLLFPGVRAARVAAHKARTKVQFNQWAAAIEGFRSEYGYYPAFDVTGQVNGGASTVLSGDHLFHDILAGKKRDGTELAAGSLAAAQNRKSLRFISFGAADFTEPNSPAPNLLRDAFDNTAIAVLVDRDLDGFIKIGGDYPALPAVAGLTPGAADFPAEGVRAGVLFYAPAPGATTTDPGFVFSWK